MTKLEATVQADGPGVRAGTLRACAQGSGVYGLQVRWGHLAHPRSFPPAPDTPLTDGSLHMRGEPTFRVFEDCMPDHWGRLLTLRAERRTAREESRAARMFAERHSDKH